MKLNRTPFFMLLAAWALLVAPVAQAQFPNFNLNKLQDTLKKGSEVLKKAQDASVEMTEANEAETGDGMAANFLGAVPLHTEAALQRYVNRVGRWVASQSARPDLKWSFAVLDTPTINAFAVPGGTIFVSIGLIKRLTNESELAGVIGHEIAHVMQRHHVKAIQALAKQDLLKIGLTEAADRSGKSGLAKEGIKVAVSSGMDVMAKGLDKSDEFEADRIGAVLSARAGYDPYGLVAVLQMLAALKAEESGISLLMSTHPTPGDRLIELEKFTAMLDKFSSQPQVTDRFAAVMANVK
jgi:predicted Zn-dependent protease